MDSNTRALWQINKYLWMTLGFVLVYLLIARAQHLLDVPVGVAWGLLGLAVLEGASRTYFAYRRGGSLAGRWAWFYTFLDILLISAAIAITRGLDSDLWLLYFVVMIFESLYTTPQRKRILDVGIILAYLLATLPYQLLTTPPPAPWPVFYRILAVRLFFLVLVSAIGRRISENAEAHSRELLLLREQRAAAEERARIAREIHDGLGHALVSTILRLELCARLLRRAPDEAEGILQEEVPALRAAWNEGRDLAFHLRPWEADSTPEEGLPAILRRHLGRFAERTGLSVSLKAEEADWRLAPSVTFGLMRIVQEALTNVARHAQASAIEVTLASTPKGGIVCTICDNGKGFVVEEQTAGFGLRSMRERTEALGGTFTITSVAGCTEIRVEVPAS